MLTDTLKVLWFLAQLPLLAFAVLYVRGLEDIKNYKTQKRYLIISIVLWAVCFYVTSYLLENSIVFHQVVMVGLIFGMVCSWVYISVLGENQMAVLLEPLENLRQPWNKSYKPPLLVRIKIAVVSVLVFIVYINGTIGVGFLTAKILNLI